MAQRTCTIDGCDKAHRARGYCSSHYNTILQPDRHHTVITCAECGKTHPTTRTNGRYCSLQCRDAERRRHKAIVGPLPWVDAAPPATPAPPTPTLRFYAGVCPHCSTAYVHDCLTTGIIPRFCSPLCAKRWHRRQWKERAGRTVPATTRALVYRRDRGVCWLCNENVQMDEPGTLMGPSLDHVVPQSHTLVPDHSAANLRLAHLICNARRGNRVAA